MQKDIEKDTVKALCIGAIDKLDCISALDQYRILGLLCMHRCAGVAYYHIKNCGKLDEISREMRLSLASIYENNCIKNQAQNKSLTYICELLKECGFNYAILKGPKLQSIYPEGARISNDIDILINREDIPKLSKILKKNGFQQGYIRNGEFQNASRLDIINALLNRGETTPFIKPVGWYGMPFLEIDVNVSIDESSFKNELIVLDMLNKSVPGIHTEKGSLFTLDKVDFLIHLCAHLYKEATIYQWVIRKQDLLLYKFLDIYLYCKNEMKEVDWLALESKIQIYSVKDAVFYSLYCTNLIWAFDDEFAKRFIEKIDPQEIKMLNCIYDPAKKRFYEYTDSFEERIFNEQHLLNTVERR